MTQVPKVIIVGGGAGGIELASKLGAIFRSMPLARVTLVSKKLTHLWKPLLHEIAAGTLDTHVDQLSYFSHAQQTGYEFQLGEMIGLNRKEKTIHLAPVLDTKNKQVIPARTLQYDWLVIAVGSLGNDFNLPGVSKYCFFLDDHIEAEKFHISCFKSYLQYSPGIDKLNEQKSLNTVVIGGGATGIELIAELYNAFKMAHGYKVIHPEQATKFKFYLIEAGPRLLPAMEEKIAQQVEKYLLKQGIHLKFNCKISAVTEETIEFDDGSSLAADLKVWAAGIKAPTFLHDLDGLETNHRNQLVVNNYLQTTQDDTIFAIGDCSLCLQASGKPVPARAQAAHQQALLLASSLPRVINGTTPLAFVYNDHGSLISLSHDQTIAALELKFFGTIRFGGWLARRIYISLYRKHQLVLFGWWRTAILIISDFLTRAVKSRLKLH